ncbi:hypothetical protein CEXT_675061 [Caerostris extrusa]|uniref:BTB domain-containing protein n=1 Tax=Caerostris extrusa TaxID=172846 RepID=A0AAV4T7I9_CAEEX|nr:hypothetical protein CEXT_675061 [Caerostris extrusa]
MDKSCDTEFSSDQLMEGTTFVLSLSKIKIIESDTYPLYDLLSLRCVYTFPPTRDISEEIERLDYGYAGSQDQNEFVKKDFLYEDPLLSDMKLKTETKTFDAHAAVLSARSEVFKIMFNIEMTEKLNRNVYISDVDD